MRQFVVVVLSAVVFSSSVSAQTGRYPGDLTGFWIEDSFFAPNFAAIIHREDGGFVLLQLETFLLSFWKAATGFSPSGANTGAVVTIPDFWIDMELEFDMLRPDADTFVLELTECTDSNFVSGDSEEDRCVEYGDAQYEIGQQYTYERAPF